MFIRDSNTNDKYIISKKSIPKNEWTHVAVVYDTTSGFKLYVNGKPYSADSKGTPRASTQSKTYLGKHPHLNRYFFDGSMDEVRIWNIARNDEEIADSYNKIIAKAEGLAGYYNFNLGTPSGFNSDVTELVNIVFPEATNVGLLKNFALQGISSNWIKSQVPLK